MSTSIPPLEPGDRLSRDEFERRYEAMPWLKKAELIEGVVYIPPAVMIRRHGNASARIVGWLGQYAAMTPGITTGLHSSARLDLKNVLQPNSLLMINPECGGQATISEDDYVEGSPELVAEVSSSSVSFDLHTKMEVYRRTGVREYIVWRVLDKAIDWFILRGGVFVPLTADADGFLKSDVFPGLWLDAESLVAGRMARVLEVLQMGLAGDAHAEIVRALRERGAE